MVVSILGFYDLFVVAEQMNVVFLTVSCFGLARVEPIYPGTVLNVRRIWYTSTARVVYLSLPQCRIEIV